MLVPLETSPDTAISQLVFLPENLIVGRSISKCGGKELCGLLVSKAPWWWGHGVDSCLRGLSVYDYLDGAIRLSDSFCYSARCASKCRERIFVATDVSLSFTIGLSVRGGFSGCCFWFFDVSCLSEG